ncbi:MAG: glycosyltransferase [Nanoarchaeota archaeon]
MENSADYKEVTVVIPTLNEERNIEKLVTLLKKTYKGIHIIVVDDGSKDNTLNVARRAGAQVIDRSQKQIHGLCISVIEGVQATKTKYVLVMDGDMQHPYEKIAEFVEKLKHCPVVVGTREQVLTDWPLQRRFMSKVAILLGQFRLFLSGISCKDIVSGFFGIHTDLFKNIIATKYNSYELKGYKILFDTLKYLPRGTKVYQVKYDFGLRAEGVSKINYKHVLYYFRSLFK